MRLQAYMDESYDDKTGLYVLGGFIAPEDGWSKISDDWQVILEKWGIPAFKMKKAVRWPAEQRTERLLEIWNILDKTPTRPFAVITNSKEVMDVLGDAPPYFTRTAYYFCVFTAIQGLLNNAPYVDEDHSIEFIFDSMPREEKKVLALWDKFVADAPISKRRFIAGPPAFRDDKNCPPLQAADYWAGRTRIRLLSGRKSSAIFDFPGIGDDANRKHSKYFLGDINSLLFYKEKLLKLKAEGKVDPFFVG